MGVLDDVLAKKRAVRGPSVPPLVESRIKSAKRRLNDKGLKDKRRLCQLFLDGDVYAYLDNKNSIQQQATNPGDRGKPQHRVRNRYNFIRPMVDAKVSSSTTRVPGYEVYPTTTDPEDLAGARLAEKLSRMGFESWGVRDARVKAATIAIGAGGKAYSLPYFDPSVGPFHSVPQDDGTTKMVGEGDIKVMVLNGNEVMAERGTSFDNSRWYIVRAARPISEIKGLDGFYGMSLEPDASTADRPDGAPDRDLVMVTMYFERPSASTPNGRMLTIANDQQICPEWDYPMIQNGVAMDEPVLHELVYRISPDDGDDLGLTWELIDFQRTLQDIYNKIVETKNRGLMLQLLAPKGSLDKARTDIPGDVLYYNPVGNLKPEWESAPDPNIIGQLLSVFDRVLNDMRYVASDVDVQASPNVALGSIQTVVSQSNNRWSQFVGGLARFDSETMRHCLMLAQEHYTEDRILRVNGRMGWEPVSAFRGADIMGQVDVTVNPATIESHTPAATLQKLAWIQANFPGYVRPEVAIEIALNGTSPDSVLDSFEYDKARINGVIQQIQAGTVMDMPKRLEADPLTQQPTVIPGWMPREFDNLDVQMWVYENWLKSPDADRLPPEMHAVSMVIYKGMKDLQARAAQEAAMAQAQQAEQLGLDNAAKPQQAKPMPSTPSPTSQGAS